MELTDRRCGDIRYPGQSASDSPDIYPENSFAEIADFCKWRYIEKLSDYVELNEGEEIWDFLMEIWQVMKQTIADGLAAEGVLPGGLKVQRKAKYLHEHFRENLASGMLEFKQIAAYAYAVAEQNADNGTIVTAPTCGAFGWSPSAMVCFMTCQISIKKSQISSPSFSST